MGRCHCSFFVRILIPNPATVDTRPSRSKGHRIAQRPQEQPLGLLAASEIHKPGPGRQRRDSTAWHCVTRFRYHRQRRGPATAGTSGAPGSSRRPAVGPSPCRGPRSRQAPAGDLAAGIAHSRTEPRPGRSRRRRGRGTGRRSRLDPTGRAELPGRGQARGHRQQGPAGRTRSGGVRGSARSMDGW